MRAPQLSPEELVEAGEAYARATGYPIQYNTTEGMPYVRPSWEKAADIARREAPTASAAHRADPAGGLSKLA